MYRLWRVTILILVQQQTVGAWTVAPSGIGHSTNSHHDRHRDHHGRPTTTRVHAAPPPSITPPVIATSSSPLSLTLDELSTVLGGKGRAQACWQCFRAGVDPSWYFGTPTTTTHTEPIPWSNLDERDEPTPWTRSQCEQVMATTAQSTSIGPKAMRLFQQQLQHIEHDVATLLHVSTSRDGTTKLLIKLLRDGLQVETVLIPWPDRRSSTLCLSSQVGCRQACTFCATGRMGKLRSLSSDEILAQVYWAHKVARMYSVYPVDNVVFMGMGEPADNAPEVVRAVQRLVDRNLFQLAPRRITVSTVGPTPESFAHLLGGTHHDDSVLDGNVSAKQESQANVLLAWSVHASRDHVRKQLVPTTKYRMEELRAGLIQALERYYHTKHRSVMLEVTLLDHINDTEQDAHHLVEFCQPILQVPGIKLMVNLIPWNDIGSPPSTKSATVVFQPPTMDRIMAFQSILVAGGVRCYIRTTRGDDESAACGQLATTRVKPPRRTVLE